MISQRERCPKCHEPMDTKRKDAKQCRACRKKQQSGAGNNIKKLRKINEEDSEIRKIESEKEARLLKNIKKEYPEDDSISTYLNNILHPEKVWISSNTPSEESGKDSEFGDRFKTSSTDPFNLFSSNWKKFPSAEELEVSPFKKIIKEIIEGKRKKANSSVSS